MTDADRILMTDVLKGVSRAFYLTLRVLPGGLRESIGLAYLLARAADTIADTRILAPGTRMRHLLAFRAAVEGKFEGAVPPGELQDLIEPQVDPRERRLLETLPHALAMLEGLPADDRRRVRAIVVQLTQGMEYDLVQFPAEDTGRIAALPSFADLDHYTYLVAGCVGEFWTTTMMAHTRALASWDRERMTALGVRFGKALQLTNVLRDVPGDLRIGRCYLPADALSAAGVAPEDLLDASNGDRARPVLRRGIELALEHYAVAEEYLLAIPRRCHRLRLASLWPVLIGLATLARLAGNADWLDPSRPSKVSRGEVYRIIAVSSKLAPSNSVLRAWIARLRERVLRGNRL